MGIFSSPKPTPTPKKRPNQDALSKAKLTHRLEKGKLNKQITERDTKIESLERKLEVQNSKIKDIEDQRDYYQKLENDRDEIERQKKVNRIAAQDIEDDRKELEHKEERLKKKSLRLEAEENDEYKKGYSDGLADGLRKAHDITREDRKYMTMIALATNQGAAIKEAQKAIGEGLKDDSSDSKGK